MVNMSIFSPRKRGVVREAFFLFACKEPDDTNQSEFCILFFSFVIIRVMSKDFRSQSRMRMYPNNKESKHIRVNLCLLKEGTPW